jgi:hypothetical protein
MFRKVIFTVFGLLIAVPAFPHTSQFPTSFATGEPHPSLHLMNDGEFAAFLDHLDKDMLRSQTQLKQMNVKSLSLDLQEREELGSSYNRCLQSLDNAREEIQKLSQKQTLKLDLFLLIDLNELARNLDALDQRLVNPVSVSGSTGAQKSLGYAKEILGIDMALATDISTFQHHLLAFTGVIDATLDHTDQSDQTDHDASQPSTQN